ncbi:MAG TPA: hypothetical protein VJ970_02205 [Flavobacteriaceae bacterium]|nr:hypothetical protein [Flavobacteriaceae bacterium]
MKKLVLITILISSSLTYSNVNKVRNEFPNINTLAKVNIYIEQLQDETNNDSKAYLGALYFLKSKYVKFPFSKWNNFKKGKTLLDEVIINSPNNIEYRYLRLLFQHQIPNFLNYNDNIDEDFKRFTQGFKISKINIAFKFKMLTNLINLDDVSERRASILKELKTNLV